MSMKSDPITMEDDQFRDAADFLEARADCIFLWQRFPSTRLFFFKDWLATNYCVD